MQSRLVHRFSPVLLALSGYLIFISGCVKNDNAVIDATGTPPFLFAATPSASVINTDSMLIGGHKGLNDLLNIRVLVTARAASPENATSRPLVYWSVSDSQSQSIVGGGLLHNDGVYPDQSASDSTYTGYLSFKVLRITVGTYLASFWCVDRNGFQSNTFVLPLKIVRANHPPVISNLFAPDVVHLNDTIRLTLQASDSDGLADIAFVGFRSLKPDSTYANSGSPIPMYDDGNTDIPSGDRIAGDGKYSALFVVPMNALIGTYEYSFQAIDHSSAKSNILTIPVIVAQ